MNLQFTGARETITIPPTGCKNLEYRWDNEISSVDPQNSCVLAYAEKYCTGRSIDLDRNTPGRNSLETFGFNDAISSFKLCSS